MSDDGAIPDAVTEHISPDDLIDSLTFDGVQVYYTPSTTVHHSEGGILSSDSTTAIPHDITAVRRDGSTVTCIHRDGDTTSVSIPANRHVEFLHRFLAVVLHHANAIEDGERVVDVAVLSELTVIITTRQLLTHVGDAVWEVEDHTQIPYSDVVETEVEEHANATTLVITTPYDKTPIKLPQEAARKILQAFKDTFTDYHDVPSLNAFNSTADEKTTETSSTSDDEDDMFADDLDPLYESEDGDELTREDLIDRIDELESTLQRQQQIIDEQTRILQQLRDRIENSNN